MEPPATRMLHLLSLLQAGGELTAAELARRMEVSERTVRRDARRLRDLGYDVRSRPGPGAGYRLRPSARIPPLVFGPDEVSAVVAGLLVLETWMPGDETLAATRAKLEQVLPRGLRHRAAATAMSMQVLQEPAEPADWRIIGLIVDAVGTGRRLGFRYADQHGRESARTVEPFRHVLRRGRWYLVAFDGDRDDWQLFRVDRMQDVRVLPERSRPREFPAGSIEHWLVTDFGRVAS